MRKPAILAAIELAYAQGIHDGEYMESCRSVGEAYDENYLKTRAVKHAYVFGMTTDKPKE